MVLKAAEQGSSSAKLCLGLFYLNGEILGQNMPKAFALLMEASDAGDEEAMYYG